jgi:hypothetical protein
MFIKMMLSAIAVAGCVLLSGPATAGGEVPHVPTSLVGSIDPSIERRMQEAGIVGLGAAIVINKKLVWSRGYGFADRERAVPFTHDTIMNIGSISKVITGAALMRAVQDGKLSLDEDVNIYLPFKVANPSFPDEPVTLRQLATHTLASLTEVLPTSPHITSVAILLRPSENSCTTTLPQAGRTTRRRISWLQSQGRIASIRTSGPGWRAISLNWPSVRISTCTQSGPSSRH